jgi:PGF-pre-PGF domain-containing protein
VTVEQVQDGVRASVENASEDDPIAVQLPEEFAGNGSAFETVSVVSDAASNFSLSISPSADRPEETPSPAADAVLSYLDVEKRNVTNAEISSARFRFRVSADALDEAGATPESVTLYRYSDGEWTTLATIPAGEQNGTYRFEAISPGFSTFAIGLADSARGSDDGSAADATETTTRTEGNEDEGATATADSEGTDDSEDAKNADSGETEQDGGVDSNTFLLGLFVVALVGAALWGYLLS